MAFKHLRSLPGIDQSIMTELDNRAAILKRRLREQHHRALKIIVARHRQADADDEALYATKQFNDQMEAVRGDNSPPEDEKMAAEIEALQAELDRLGK